jgi:anti-sigma factor RsiW
MKEDVSLKLQALLDGELSREATAEFQRLLADDAEAKALTAELSWTRDALKGNEPAHPLPVRGDFYWQGIQQAIQKDTPVKHPAAPARPSWISLFYKLLAPAGAALALALILLPVLNRPAPVAANASTSVASFNVESMMPNSSVVTFCSEKEGVTVVWIDTQ